MLSSIFGVMKLLECVRTMSFEKSSPTHWSACQIDFWSSRFNIHFDRSIHRSLARSLGITGVELKQFWTYGCQTYVVLDLRVSNVSNFGLTGVELE